MVGTLPSPAIFAAINRPWPAITPPASSIRIGLTKPNDRMEATN